MKFVLYDVIENTETPIPKRSCAQLIGDGWYIQVEQHCEGIEVWCGGPGVPVLRIVPQASNAVIISTNADPKRPRKVKAK